MASLFPSEEMGFWEHSPSLRVLIRLSILVQLQLCEAVHCSCPAVLAEQFLSPGISHGKLGLKALLILNVLSSPSG